MAIVMFWWTRLLVSTNTFAWSLPRQASEGPISSHIALDNAGRERTGDLFGIGNTARYGAQLINKHVWRKAYLQQGDSPRDVWPFMEDNICWGYIYIHESTARVHSVGANPKKSNLEYNLFSATLLFLCNNLTILEEFCSYFIRRATCIQ